ncbi:hypothetical protein EMCRGX_G009974 [Ephydatia muelleri]
MAVQRITNSNKLLLHTTYKCLCLRLSLQCTVESTLASPITVESTLASPITVESTLASPITVESTLASPITVESTLASPITVESTLASPITVESTLASPITVESTLASPITVESTLASPITVESTLASPITQKVLSGTPSVSVCSSSCSLLAVSVIPSVGLGLHLESNKYQAALRWWLRLDTSVTCRHGGDVVIRHNLLRNLQTWRRCGHTTQSPKGPVDMEEMWSYNTIS